MSSVMTLEHPRWQEFVDRLQGEEGCNWIHVPAVEVKDGKVIDNEIDWDFPGIAGDKDLDICRKILERMGDIDVEGSLEYFRKYDVADDAEVVSLQFLIDMQAPPAPEPPDDSETDEMFK
ncbi:MAG: hypothetical protein NTZ49_01835 [Candidatus Parcubacteria bacterium]|nr:hypothetical protein [Candidatus Parcubacteria bacterium]